MSAQGIIVSGEKLERDFAMIVRAEDLLAIKRFIEALERNGIKLEIKHEQTVTS